MTDEPYYSTITLVKARKEHYCCECPAKIVKGEYYERLTGVWDGRGRTFKTCTPCAEVRYQFLQDIYQARDWNITTTIGHLQSEMEEYYG